MARIFITGSTDGLGRAAARSLLDEGHEVVLHARSTERASTLADLASQAAGPRLQDASADRMILRPRARAAIEASLAARAKASLTSPMP